VTTSRPPSWVMLTAAWSAPRRAASSSASPTAK
jgi:hypothetical protein